ncbi:hypothetical protein SAMN04244560_02731 [Thermoanaerobacter thermohydrosulfuricus]|uniref:Uncharacterized protein n=1 Tax=Thermoanaerobacter thermohydrosulfuricus TaxID=1516 RepID=A0A1G7W2Y9_THETY|nr:hypothetical protein SAMN04244560_02731 [Thermoanaerobacter thermohydrosulfuricus]
MSSIYQQYGESAIVGKSLCKANITKASLVEELMCLIESQ